MTSQYKKIILKSGKEKSLERFHPWIFSGAIKQIVGHIEEGDIVEVFSNNGEYLATGHYQIGSIAVRIVSFEQIEIDFSFWKNKIEKALQLRKSLNLTDNSETDVYRLIHGEGDGLPGLIIDIYADCAVIQAHSIGMWLSRETFANILTELYGEKLVAILDKSESTLPFKAQIEPKNAFLFGEKKQTIVSEYGSKFIVDIFEGQKTGFFVDQRENRKLLEKYCKNKKVLNTFCYTGGFSVAALKGGAHTVHSVDSSQRATDVTTKNIELNPYPNTQSEQITTDAFDYLNHLPDDYDVIVLDPPAFAKHTDVLDKAIKGYRNINRKAMEKIKSGGILFTFSCSQVVSKEEFRKAVFSAAILANRNVRILHQLTQPEDHPINIYHLEGEYLKGLVLYIE